MGKILFTNEGRKTLTVEGGTQMENNRKEQERAEFTYTPEY
jgi:hypothetical protein